MTNDVPLRPSARDWAEASLRVAKVEQPNQQPIYELQKELVINGVQHIQFVWVNQSQLRSVGIDHGL